MIEKFGRNVVVRRNNNNDIGLFGELRKYQSPISDIELTSKDSFPSSSGYCYTIDGKDVSCLIDGKDNTGWANKERLPGYASFLVDFKSSRFQLEEYSFTVECNPPGDWLIYGSNNKEHWTLLDNKTSIPMPVDEEVFFETFSSENKQSFRYFNITSPYITRFHLRNLEFFGVLNPIRIITCKEKTNIAFRILIYNLFAKIK